MIRFCYGWGGGNWLYDHKDIVASKAYNIESKKNITKKIRKLLQNRKKGTMQKIRRLLQRIEGSTRKIILNY